ncbi:hypothetical protein M8C21_007446 [Ambrosia artemisiifolia]|uniref:EngB-type G domain-containing protein n=1 Tax=Ambrosia artemisiifolia TaxID=4212 RepID=A0AAD5D3B1_AMBAR|nr:hypothetical protein M8C21_007446 [Ambrosia artemisiifolia]
MNQETRSKHSNLKKRAKFGIGKSVGVSRDKSKTLDSKKPGRRNDGGKLKNENASGYRGKSNYRGRKEGEFHRHENDGFAGRDFGGKNKRVTANDAGSKFNRKWESRDSGGDKRKKGENGESRNGFSRKYGDVKSENSGRLRGHVEEVKFGMKKVKSRKNVDGDSVATFDRPRRKRRLIRIEYPHDTANKRFDDSLPVIDNTKEQKKDPDTEEENVEMSKNAQFRAIQPSPSIISFVNENLLGRRREIEFKKAGYNIELSSPLDNVPFSTSSERERIEESVFRNKLAFFAAAKVSSSFPSPDLPEIAFAGRSNVGKSSLLNSLTRQWGVVRTSDKPGLTQTINFFNLGPKLCLVDLPGYGFAYAKEEVKESWEELVKEYVSTREGLKRVCLLIDTKWGMKPRDHELVDLMERSKTKYQIVLTKTDLAFPIDVARRAMQIEEVSLKTKKSAIQPLMMVSSKTGAGIRSLRTVLSNVSRFARL